MARSVGLLTSASSAWAPSLAVPDIVGAGTSAAATPRATHGATDTSVTPPRAANGRAEVATACRGRHADATTASVAAAAPAAELLKAEESGAAAAAASVEVAGHAATGGVESGEVVMRGATQGGSGATMGPITLPQGTVGSPDTTVGSSERRRRWTTSKGPDTQSRGAHA